MQVLAIGVNPIAINKPQAQNIVHIMSLIILLSI